MAFDAEFDTLTNAQAELAAELADQPTAASTAPNAVIRCDGRHGCDDTGHCSPEHKDARVFCGRCAGTGAFITYVENGIPKGPGGPCYRCNGKGFHTAADRKRNVWYDRLAVSRAFR